MEEHELIKYGGHKFRGFRAVCITLVPPAAQTIYEIDSALEQSVSRFVQHLGPSCRISKFQWIVRTDAPSAAIWQDLHGTTSCNLLIFAFLPDVDFKFSTSPESALDEWDWDGVAAFLQGNPTYE